MPNGFDYRSMLVRYIGRIQYQEGVSYFNRTDFTLDEAKEVALLVDEAEKLWNWNGPTSPRTPEEMWVDDTSVRAQFRLKPGS